MLPHRTPSGETAAPSDSLVFMERLFGREKDAPSLVIDLDSTDTLDSIRFLAKAPPANSRSPESATPAITGTLVHGVLSRLFPTGKPLIQKRGLDEMRLAVESVLTDLARQYAPFLLSPQWRGSNAAA